MNSWVLIYSRGYNLLLSFNLILKLSLIWPVGFCLLCHFDMFSSSFNTSLRLFGKIKKHHFCKKPLISVGVLVFALVKIFD